MDWLTPIRELFGFAFPILERLPIIRAILGFILVFFLPGFTWTLVFFKRINVIEMVVLSLGLSIVIVTLSLFSVNRLIGVRITGFNSVMVITVVTILPVIVYYLNRFVRRRENDIEKEAVIVEAPPKSPVEDVTTEGIEGMVTEEAVDIVEEVTT